MYSLSETHQTLNTKTLNPHKKPSLLPGLDRFLELQMESWLGFMAESVVGFVCRFTGFGL